MIRYADDFVIGVAREDDARRIMEVLPKRMSKHGLTVHPEKTRLVRFQPPQTHDSETEERDPPGPTTFDFLGFTHYWGRSGAANGWSNGRRRRADSSALAALSEWCRKNMHLSIREQHHKLTQNLRGHFGYHGIIGNFSSLQAFGKACEGYGATGCLGVAGSAHSRGLNSFVWRSGTVFPVPRGPRLSRPRSEVMR